jgi:hypothetical protein
MEAQNRVQWPAIGEARIKIAINDAFIGKFLSAGDLGARTPIDSLLNLGLVLLQEVSPFMNLNTPAALHRTKLINCYR